MGLPQAIVNGRQLTALGGDIFAGLFTVGIKRAGFKVLGHLEHGPYGVATAKKNFPDLDVRIGPHAWHPEDYRNKVDFMYCNPPCAAWSNMRTGAKQTWQDQTARLACVTDLVRAGGVILPNAWCWESVLGAWRAGREFVLEQATIWNQRGYHVTILLQNNMYLGTAQNRERMFLIAHKYPLIWPKFSKPVTVEQAFKKIPKNLKPPPFPPRPLANGYDLLWERSAPHGYLQRAYFGLEAKELKLVTSKPLGVHRRLIADKPAPVMMEDMKRLHPTEPRCLTWHEWMALTGLPWNWQTACHNFNSASLELSRAVMPPVGEWLGKAVADGIGTGAKVGRKAETWFVDLRKPDEQIRELLFAHTAPFDRVRPEWNPEVPEPKVQRAGANKPKVYTGPTKPGSGARIRELLSAGRSTGEILETIHQEFPGSKATASDVSWNKRKLRQLQGE